MSRQKKLDKMDVIELAAERPKPEFNFKTARTPGRYIFQTKIPPAITQNRKRNVRCSILHYRVRCHIALDEIKIFIHSMNLRIPRPFQHSGLNLEGFT